MTLFPSLSRRKRSHGHRHYTPARLNEVSLDELLPLINEPLGLHHIRTKLYSIPLVSMNKLRDKCLNSTNFDKSSNEYGLNSIILDIANCRMFLPVKSDFSNVSTDKFLKLKFANKGIDTLNIGNILNHKEVTKHIPAYFKCQATPKISYTYTNSVASKVFNYKQSIRDFKLNEHGIIIKVPADKSNIDILCHESMDRLQHE